MSRILIIDDSDLVANLLKEALQEAGHETALAMDANQGYATAISFRPDLILLDVQLPDVLGLDLVNILKNREDLKAIPIIMITGSHHQTEFKVRAFKSGVDDYILKPFEMPELIERVGAVLRRSKNNPAPIPLPPAKVAQPPAKVTSPAPLPTPPPPVPKPEITPIPAPEIKKAPTPAAAPTMAPRPKALPLFAAVRQLLLEPQAYPFQAPLPPSGMAFLISALALGFAGLAAAAGATIKPALFTLFVLLAWVTMVSVLVMTSSVIGITMSWKEGGRLFSLAMTPLLVKLAGGTVTSLWTSLSPFHFIGGPAIFLKAPSFLLERVDVFEIGAMGLLWWCLRHRPASSPKRAAMITGLVWLAGVVILMAARKLGS